MNEKANTQYSAGLKRSNEREVLKCLKENQDISRAGIARATGLSKPTVSVLVSELIANGYVIEHGNGDVNGGRKPIMLSLNSSYKYAVGLDYSSSRKIRGCICDMSYRIVAECERPCPASQEDILELTAELIDELLQAVPATRSLEGIGIGMTGIVDTVKNRVILSERYDRNIDYSGYLQNRYGVPVFLENDSNVAALSEHSQGCAKGKDSFIYIFCSEVIGMAIFLNKSLFQGNMFNSGEIIHMRHEGITERCSCGGTGCIGIKLSENYILSQINTSEKKVNSIEQAYSLYNNFHPQAEAALDEAAGYLSRLIANTSKLLGVDDFVIGGFFTGFGDRFLNKVIDYTKREHFGLRQNTINIQYSTFLENGVAHGAASLVLDKVWDLSI